MSVFGLDIVGRICRPTMTLVHCHESLIKKAGIVCARSSLGCRGQTDPTKQSCCFDIHRCGWLKIFGEVIMQPRLKQSRQM